MKAGWQTKKLGDVCSFENGDRGVNYPSRSARTSQGIPFINAGHLTDDGIDIERLDYIPRERFDLLGSGKIRAGDILFCLRGSLGKCASVGSLSEGAIASSLVIVRPRESVQNAYVMAYFQSNICSDMINRFKNGAAQPNLSAHSLSSFTIPVPPILEQQRIVGILDEAFDGIATAKANAEKNLQNARALMQSALRSALSPQGGQWLRTTIGEQVMLQRGFDITKDEQKPGSVPVVSSGGVKSFHDTAMVKAPGVATGRKGTLGKVFYLDVDFWPHDTTLWVKEFNGNNARFVYYFFSNLDVIHLDSGTANPALNRNLVHPIEVDWPPVSQQKAIGEKLDSISAQTQRLESIYQQKLAALDGLKKSLLDQAFTGVL
jgi:type I restriction enzyme S subunit